MSASQHLSQRWHGRHLPPIGLVIIVAAGALVLFGHLGQPPRLAATVAAASGPLQNATPSPTAIPEAPAELPGLIAYTRRADTDYVWEIFQSRADGSDDHPITHHELAGKGADAPRWSPDGQWTVYATTDKSGQTVTLWRMGHAGGTPAPLATVRSPQAGAASIGPDADQIVFVGPAVAGPSAVDLLLKASGQAATALVTTSQRDEDMPDWSAATGRVVFSARELEGPAAGRGWDLYVVNADGSAEALVVGAEGVSECSPRWSPDGRSVAYLAIAGQTCFGAGTLKVHDLDTGQERAVIGGASIQAAWSPDGLWLLTYNTYNGGLYPPGAVTPAPQSRLQLKGLYVVRLADSAVFRLRGAAGGSLAKEGSYLWGQVADWTGGTQTPTPPISPTPSPSASPEPSLTPTPSVTPVASDTPSPSATSATPRTPTPPSATPSASPEASPTGGHRPRLFLPLLLKDWQLTNGNKRR
ncbi:MAG: hypothetical protein ACH37Z_05115 [Anaerolineae bacterium]